MNRIIFKALRYSGLAFLFREIVQRNKVTILLFHDIDSVSAENAFEYLTAHYHIISLNSFINAVNAHNAKVIPHKTLIITLDDGHISNYDLLPIIRKYQIPVTIFLCSGIVGTHHGFWFRHLESASEVETLKKIPNRERLALLSKYGFEQDVDCVSIQALQDSQINEMKEVVDMQSHTIYHPILPQCDDTTAEEEIRGSKESLEKRYGLSIRSISYPNGDYSQRDIDMAKNSGYESGLTVDPGYNTIYSDLFRLKRFSVNDAKSMDELIVKSSGCYAFIKNIFHKRTYGLMK